MVEDITPGFVQALAKRLRPAQTPQSLNRHVIAVMSMVINKCAEDNRCHFIKIPRFKFETPLPRTTRYGVEQRLLDNTEGYHYLFLTFIFEQGTRITETLSLEWEKVDLQNEIFELRINKAKTWKKIPMFSVVSPILKSIPDKTGYVFPWRARSSVYKWLTPLRRRLGIEFTPHMARHDFATIMNEEGSTSTDILSVSSWTNEASIKRYTNVNMPYAKSVLSRKNVGKNKGSKTKAIENKG